MLSQLQYSVSVVEFLASGGWSSVICTFSRVQISSIVLTYQSYYYLPVKRQKSKHLSNFSAQVSVIFNGLPTVNSAKPISNVLQSIIPDVTMLHFQIRGHGG